MWSLAFLGLVMARPPAEDLIISPEQLATAAGYVLVDCRSNKSFVDGHLPGAVGVDVPKWSKMVSDAPERESWEKALGDLGIDLRRTIIVYGDDIRDTARVWWLLRFLGGRDVRLLDGGIKGWQKSGGKLDKGEAKPMRAEVRIDPQPSRLATKDDVLKTIKESSAQLFDARSAREHAGLAPTAKRNGCIPGSKHLEWTNLIDPETERFKSPDELRKLLANAGIDANRPAITYCQSGGRAAVAALAIELATGKPARNYYRSWSEWGNDPATPVEKAPPKK